MSHGFTPRQVRMLYYMHINGSMTKNEQSFFTAPFFYYQISRLIHYGYVKCKRVLDTRIQRNIHVYSLTKEGHCLASHLKAMVTEEDVLR